MNSQQIFLINATDSQIPTANASTQKNSELTGTTQVNLENVEDFSNVCRTCAAITEFVIPIFDGEGLQNNLADKIHKHLPIQVSSEDRLPVVVCYQCASTLLAWHELVACCAQADVTLRTALAHRDADSRRQKIEAVDKDDEISLEKDQQIKFKEIADFVVQSLEPPQYVDSSSSTVAEPSKTCDYCESEFAVKDYEDHLITTHLDLLFQCDECDTYVDRKDFILHMSLHAIQYAANQESTESPKKKKNKRKEREKDENANNEKNKKEIEKSQQKIGSIVQQVEIEIQSHPYEKLIANTTIVTPENEFSDHSDPENGFGPLPESVFTAIEDSQESQVVDGNETITSQITENEANDRIESDNSNHEAYSKSSPPPDIFKGNENQRHKKSRTCPICSKVYTASSSYFYHMKYFHRRSREHQCDVCGRKFGTKGTLAQHSSIHTGECQFECKECSKKFRSRASLYIHEQSHSGVKIWPCSQCHRSFRWKTHLLRHMKRHSAQKEHVCTTCGRGFNIRCDLLRHARTHTAGNFTCDKCGLKFAQLRYLKVHIDRKHSTAIVSSKTQDVPGSS